MNPAQICSLCQQPLTQVGKHWICPEHGQIPPRSSRGSDFPSSFFLLPSSLKSLPLLRPQ
jgi:hypothetical protein